MNRKIKLRAYNVTEKKWVNSLDDIVIGIIGEGNIFSVDANPFLAQTDTIVLMQYTGLEDKNGKDIYEGDILRQMSVYPRESESARRFNGFIGQAYYDTEFGCWYITTTPKDGRIHEQTLEKATLREYEIIGNIYENPGLLK